MRFTSKVILIFAALLITRQIYCNQESIDNKVITEFRLNQANYERTLELAQEVIRSGFSAGDGYGEVWIRDFATFMELACHQYPAKDIQEKLEVFFHFQGSDGHIVDGYIPTAQAKGGYDYISSESKPEFKAHKNTVETDQESSLIIGIGKYIQSTGNRELLDKEIQGITILRRLEMALDFLMNERYNIRFGLLWGATTVDWGDVQPEHDWGVFLTDDSHLAIDIYDNALFLIALNHYLNVVDPNSPAYSKWSRIRAEIKKNVMKHLWDETNHKFIPHLYLKESPFPDDFLEHEIYYHGGTIVAIQAGLLNSDQILSSLHQMIENTRKCGAASIGLTVYPPYPKGLFKNPILTNPYTYQNGGDWTWFGARLIPVLIEKGMVQEAIKVLNPMVNRVVKNDGFYEWYDLYNQPRGSGTYRGSAGVLFTAIQSIKFWASENQKE